MITLTPLWYLVSYDGVKNSLLLLLLSSAILSHLRVIGIMLNSVLPKEATGRVFARPTNLCLYTHDLCVNANSPH